MWCRGWGVTASQPGLPLLLTAPRQARRALLRSCYTQSAHGHSLAQTVAGGAGWLEGMVASLTFLWIQVSLKTSALGSSVEEVEQLIRKHELFLKVLTAQDKKVMGSGVLAVVRVWGSGESPEGGHRELGVFPESVLISLRG